MKVNSIAYAFCAIAAPVLSFAFTSSDYIQDGLIYQFDAIENAGHLLYDPTASTWKNLAGEGVATIVNSSGAAWSDTSLTMDGSRYATFEGDFGSLFTVEIVCDTPLAEVTANAATYFSSSDNEYAVYRNGRTGGALKFNQPVAPVDNLYGYANAGFVLVFNESNVSIVGQGQSLRTDAVKEGSALPTGLRTWVIGGTDAAHALNGRIFSLRVYNRPLSTAEIETNTAIDHSRFINGDFIRKNFVTILNSSCNTPDIMSPVPALGCRPFIAGEEITFSVDMDSYSFGSETGRLLGWTLTVVRDGKEIVTSGTGISTSFTPQEGDAVKFVWNWDRTDEFRWIARQTNVKWNTTSSAWEDGIIPPSDVDSVVITYNTFAGGTGSGGNPLGMKQMIVAEPDAAIHNQFVSFGHDVNIGSGGISMNHNLGRIYLSFNRKVEAVCDQLWALDASVENISGAMISGELSIPKDVTLTVAGRRAGLNFTKANPSGDYCKGRIRSNGRFEFASLQSSQALGDASIFWTNTELDGNPVYTNKSGLAEVYATFNITKDGVTELANDIEFAMTNKNHGTTMWNLPRVNTYPLPVDFTHTFNGKWSGVIDDDLFKFSWKRVSDSTTTLPDPFQVGRIVFDMDGTGLSTNDYPALRYHYGVYEVANNNALGCGNSLGAVFGTQAANDPLPTGTAVAYIASPGVTIGGDIRTTLDDILPASGYLYNVHGFQIYLGAFDPGEVWYTGNIANRDSKWKKTANGYTYCTPDQFRLTAVKGATAHFSGALSGGKGFPFEVHGAGNVELSGDNSGIECGLSVRGGNLIIATVKSAGIESLPISLGGTVPSVADVDFFESNFGGGSNPFKAQWTAGSNNTTFTKKDALPIVFDGVEMQVGERVYICSDIPNFAQGIYIMTSPTVIEKDSSFKFEVGQHIRIAKGNKYGGTAKMVLKGSNGGVAQSTWEPAEPDVGLYLKNGISLPNSVDVLDNLSSGISAIGVADATENTISGNVTMAKAIAFDVAPGAKLTLAGALVDAGSEKNSIAIRGAGTVALPEIEWAGRTLDVSNISDEQLDQAGRPSVLLMEAAGVGQASVISPSDSRKWHISVHSNTVRATKGGLFLMLK